MVLIDGNISEQKQQEQSLGRCKKINKLGEKGKQNSNMFGDLYDQLSHRRRLPQVGWAPLIGPSTVRTVAVGPGFYPKEGSRCRAYTHKCSRLSMFLPQELQGGAMNLRTGGSGQSRKRTLAPFIHQTGVQTSHFTPNKHLKTAA